MLERFEMVVGDAVVVDQRANRLFEGHRGELLNVFRGAAETGTAQ